MSTKGLVACVAVALAVILGLVWLVESQTPNSTKGVTIVGANEARLPTGETFVLTHQIGKTRYTYLITFDGRSVYFSCDGWFCDDLPTTAVQEVGQVVEVDAGWWNDDFYVMLRPDGAVSVTWPWGWTYRPY